MECIIRKARTAIIIVIPILILMNFLLVDVFKTDTEIFNLMIYGIAYIIIALEIFFINDCKILSGPVLAVLLYSLSIGLGPIAYYFFLGRTCEAQYSIILIGIFSFLIGDIFYKIRIKKNVNERKVVDTDKKSKKDKSYKILEIILWTMLGISIAASLYYLYTNRQLFFGGNYDNGRISAMSGNGMILQAIGLSIIALCMMFELLLNGKINKTKFVIFTILTLPTTLVTGFRSTLIAPIMIMLIMYNKKYNIKTKKIIIILAIGTFIIFAMGIVRQILSDGVMKWYNSFLLMFANGSINLNAIFNTFPQKVEFQKGYGYLINILMLRPGEDPDFTLWLKDQVGYSFNGGGMTPTIIGEIYINYGKILIPVILFVFGIIVNKIERMDKDNLGLYYSSYCLYVIAGAVGAGICTSEVSFLITTIVYISIYKLSQLKI